MAITNKLNFTKPQLRKFAVLFKNARLQAGVTQRAVALAAFDYHISHCKVSRIERQAMPKVDAHCLERMAIALSVPRVNLLKIDPKFNARAHVVRGATEVFWTNTAA